MEYWRVRHEEVEGVEVMLIHSFFGCPDFVALERGRAQKGTGEMYCRQQNDSQGC